MEDAMESTNPPQPLSLLSLPEDIVLLCLARVSSLFYTKLYLVSKRFKCLLDSSEIDKVQCQFKTQEKFIYVSLESPEYPFPKWFTLLLKPGHQPTLPKYPLPMSFSELLKHVPQPNEYHGKIQELPSPWSALKCTENQLVPAPPLMSFSEWLHYSSTGEAPKDCKVWKQSVTDSRCVIEGVEYMYRNGKCWWCQTSSTGWSLVEGLNRLNRYPRNDIKIVGFSGKLVIFWDSPDESDLDKTKKIWCAMILLDKTVHGEVWGHIEWVDVVLRISESYTLSRTL